MRRFLGVLVLVLILGSAYADLQNVLVGGEIRIRGRYWENGPADTPFARMPAAAFNRRALGPFGAVSTYDFDERGSDLKFVEQRTALSVRGDFTDGVSAFIELEDYERWGQDFRSNYLTGIDNRANTADDVEVHQAYIDVKDLYGQPLSVRIGRQEITMGKAWLLGSQVSPTLHYSYDGIRLTYKPIEKLTIDAWWAKLAENGTAEEDGDVDYYGVYATYVPCDYANVSAYWTFIRDAVARADTYTGWFGDLREDVLGLDDYDPTSFHTVGLRVWGKYEGFDYDLEAAYQFGNADSAGALFQTTNVFGTYGDDGAEYDAWAGDLELGYTFDYTCKPRVYLGGAYFEGEDKRDMSFWDTINPFYKSEASVSFNRLFSGIWYSSILDIVGGAADMSNFWQARVGLTANACEAVTVGGQVAYYGVVEPFDWPAYVTLPGIFRFPPLRFPLAPGLPFWTCEADDEIGWVTHLWVRYQYSKDLWIRVGWEHLFTGDGLEDGSFVKKNALEMLGGTDDDDANYFYFDTQVKF